MYVYKLYMIILCVSIWLTLRARAIGLWGKINAKKQLCVVYPVSQLMLSENTRVRAKIQTAFEQLAMPHVAKVSCNIFYVLMTCMCSKHNLGFIPHAAYLSQFVMKQFF